MFLGFSNFNFFSINLFFNDFFVLLAFWTNADKFKFAIKYLVVASLVCKFDYAPGLFKIDIAHPSTFYAPYMVVN